MKLFFISFLFSCSVFAATEFTLKTPRGTDVPVILHRSNAAQPRAIIVVAPGQSCNYRNALFEKLGTEGEYADVAIARFEWSYCSRPNKEDRVPADDLATEIEDFKTVLTFAQTFSFGDAQRVFIGGKSLGSIVAYKVFANDPSLKGLLLLTPVFSYTTETPPNTLPQPIDLGAENYPQLANEKRPLFIASGDQDPLCYTPILYSNLKNTTGNVGVIVAVGDHGFRSKNKNNEVDEVQTRHNINSIMYPIFNWLSSQIAK